MLITRLAKILMCLALALFCLLVAYDNVTDPHSNYEFVQHVMSMDTTFPDNKLMYRSVTNPILWQIVYALIIATAVRLRRPVPRRRHAHVADAATPRPPTSIRPRLTPSPAHFSPSSCGFLSSW